MVFKVKVRFALGEEYVNAVPPLKKVVNKSPVKAEAFATKAAYMVELSLHLPKKRLMAKEDDHTMVEAIDLAVDKLIIQLRKLTKR